MPGNTIEINNCQEMVWYIGDSKMPELISVLNQIGIKMANKSLKVDGFNIMPVITTDLCKECDKLRIILSIKKQPTT